MRNSTDEAEIELDRSVPVLLAKIGYYPLHHGSLGAVRSLGRAGVPVYAITERRYTPTGVSRWLAGQFEWGSGRLDHDDLLARLKAIGDRIGSRPLLLPTDDRMAVFVAEYAEQLRPLFRFPNQAPEVARGVADKFQLSKICAELVVSTPRVLVPGDTPELLAFGAELAFPVVAKVIDASVISQAKVKSTSIIPTPRELLALWGKIEHYGHGTLMLQEHIPEGEDWIVHAYCDERSDAIAAYTGVKLRSCPPLSGPTSLGRTQQNEPLVHQAQALFHRLGYRGIVDMDWRLDRCDGKCKLLDFNPRVGAQFRMFVDQRGLDVVRAMHLDMTGRSVPFGRPSNGRKFLVENYELAAAIRYRRAGQSWPEWWRSLHGIDELGWFARDDLRPAVALAAYLAARAGKGALGRAAKLFMLPSRTHTSTPLNPGSAQLQPASRATVRLAHVSAAPRTEAGGDLARATGGPGQHPQAESSAAVDQ